MDGVLVTGTAEADVVGECVRCLEPVSDHVGTDLQELYLYAEAGPEDDETSRLEGDLIDLEPVVRAAVVLALPFQPVCSDDCPGLCTQCGVALASSPGHHHEAELDPRWQELADFRQTLDDPGTSRVSDPSGQVKE